MFKTDTAEDSNPLHPPQQLCKTPYREGLAYNLIPRSFEWDFSRQKKSE